MTWLYTLVTLLLLISNGLPIRAKVQKYSFCSENTRFVFTAKACPGGVLFKQPVLIDEPCHCFSSDLLVFENCGTRNGTMISHSVTQCSRSLQTARGGWKGKAQLLLPIQSMSIPSEDEYCHGLPTTCKLSKKNMALKNPGFVINEIEDMSPFLSPRKGRKVRTSRPILPHFRSSQAVNKKRYRRDADTSTLEPDQETSTDSSIDSTTDEGTDASTDSSIDSTTDEGTDASTDSSIDSTTDEGTDASTDSSIDSTTDEGTDASNESSTLTNTSGEAPEDSSKESTSPPEIPIDEVPLPEHKMTENELDNVLEMMKILDTIESNSNRPNKVGGKGGVNELKFFRLLEVTKDLFKKIASDIVIRDDIVDEAFEIFRSQILANSDLPTLVEMDEKISSDMVKVIELAIDECEVDGQVIEYVFQAAPGCPPKLGAYVHGKTGAIVPNVIEKMPKAYRYAPQKEDLIIGLTWKMIDAIHARCYGTWMNSNKGPVPFFYWSFLENFFRTPEIMAKFYPSNNKGTSMYDSFLESDRGLEELMENVDSLVAAIHLRSTFPGYFNKPSMPDQSSPVSEPEPERKKRNVKGGEDFEIWEGRAYCLQKLDYFQPPGFDNSFPRIDYLCKN